MLKIKLARFGKRNQPHYRIVVSEARSKRDGQSVALLGHYAPTQSPKILELDLKAYESWVKQGAQPTDTVAALAKRAASKDPFPKKKPTLSKKAKAKAQAAAEEKEAAKNAPKEEAPVAEPKTEVVEAESAA